MLTVTHWTPSFGGTSLVSVRRDSRAMGALTDRAFGRMAAEAARYAARQGLAIIGESHNGFRGVIAERVFYARPIAEGTL